MSRKSYSIVESIQDDPTSNVVGIMFTTLAAVYFLEKNHTAFREWMNILQESLDKQLPVEFTYNVDGQFILTLDRSHHAT